MEERGLHQQPRGLVSLLPSDSSPVECQEWAELVVFKPYSWGAPGAAVGSIGKMKWGGSPILL
jgi:hypothetical protein